MIERIIDMSWLWYCFMVILNIIDSSINFEHIVKLQTHFSQNVLFRVVQVLSEHTFLPRQIGKSTSYISFSS